MLTSKNPGMDRITLCLPVSTCLLLLLAAPALAQDTATEATIAAFNPASTSSLIQASDGNFYGTSSDGGYDSGSIYRITPQGIVTQIHKFNYTTDGQTPSGPLVEGPDGELYGTAIRGGNNGAYSCGSGFTCGTAYKISKSGVFTLLYTFTGGTDGYGPSPLALGDDGNFYGAAQYGGGPANDCEGSYTGGCGTVFSLTPSGQLSTIFTFISDGATGAGNGGYPYGQFVQASDGNFYGSATLFNYVPQEGELLSTYYILYRVSKGGAEGTVYQSTYSNTSDPSLPSSPGIENFNLPLAEGSDNSLYGTTPVGAANDNAYSGTVFKMSFSGTPTVLAQFPEVATGSAVAPYAPVFLAGDGLFYGSLAYDGADGYGSVFNMTYGGNLTDLHDFPSIYSDGSYPGQITQGGDGNFYGTTGAGGVDPHNYGGGYGTVWKMTVSPAPPAPVQLTLSEPTIVIGKSTTLNWQVLNAFSLTLQQCYLYATTQGVETPEGKLTGTLASNIFSGSIKLTPPVGGSYSLAIICGGQEAGFATLTVTEPPTSTTLAAMPNPVTIGQNITLNATVTGSGPAPTGSVTFNALGTVVATVKVNGSGVATYTASTATLGPGTYPVTAQYSGDGNHAASTSSAVDVVLSKPATTTTLSVTPGSVTPPANVTLMATVTRSGASGTPTGTVTFSVGSTVVGSAKVNSSGVASLTHSTSGIGAGKYPVVAKYSGDSQDGSSVSAAKTVTVQ